MSFEVSTFHGLVVGSWNWVWNILVVLLLLLLRLFIIAILLLHSSSLTTLGIVLSVETTVLLETSSSASLHGAASLAHSVLSEIATSATSHVTALSTWTTKLFLHAWRLFTVLILNTLQGKSKLLCGQRFSSLSEFFVTMCKVALFSKVTVLVSFIMSASLGLVLLVDVIILLGSHLKLRVELIHLTSHHWLVGHLSGRVWGHHTHHLHLWVHLVLLDILLLRHLLHVHLLHRLHAGHCVLLGH